MTEDVTWLFGPERAGTLNSSGSRCSDVWEVPASDRCTFALTVADCRSGEALLDYVELLYCRWQALPVPPLLPLIGLFLLCGGLVCALAGGFVSPALVLLKNRFQLDEAKAGATLLTLGNGIPDIMGAMAAVNMGHEGLVVGEVLGGTLFVVGVIIGTLYTVGGRAPLGRGFGGLLFFFALAVLYVGHIYVTGSVTGTHIAIGATIYVAYYAYIFSIPSKKESLALILSNSVNVNEKTPFLATNNKQDKVRWFTYRSSNFYRHSLNSLIIFTVRSSSSSSHFESSRRVSKQHEGEEIGIALEGVVRNKPATAAATRPVAEIRPWERCFNLPTTANDS